MNIFEGCFILDNNRVIYDVKGFEHPPNGYIVFPRYVPDDSGDRVFRGIRYSKIYALKLRFDYMRKHFPRLLVYDDIFGREIPILYKSMIKEVFDPKTWVEKAIKNRFNLDSIEKKALDFIELLTEHTGLDTTNFGVSGSICIGIHKSDSDLDIIVYGTSESRKVMATLARLFRDGVISRYSEKEYRQLYYEREVDGIVNYDLFLMHEKRKYFQGIYNGKRFFIRFLRDINENPCYGEYRYRQLGKVKITAKVLDDSESIYTPCKYIIEPIRIDYEKKLELRRDAMWTIESFRGKFCQHAFRNETVEVYGNLEIVYKSQKLDRYRILLGESKEDYMISILDK